MTISYIQAIAEAYPTIQCHADGDGSTYASIIHDGGPAIPTQATLDSWIVANPTLPNQTIANLSISANNTLQVWNGNSYVTAGMHLSDLLDANISNPTAGQTIMFNGTSWVNVVNSSASKFGDIYTGQVDSMSGTSIIPADTSQPGSNEGSLVWSQVVTPASTNSKFAISQTFMIDCSSSRTITVAIFRGSTCVYATGVYTSSAGRVLSFSPRCVDAPNTTNNVTYSVRIGANSSSTWYINQNYNNTLTYGNNVNTSDWTIMEIL